MGYAFYGWESAVVRAVSEEYPGIATPQDLYDALQNIWCEYTCAPRLRDGWCEENKTLGQCSITAFLVQDIFGGEVYGILRPGGNYHCYNKVGESVFDLTSEQFGDEKLDYSDNPQQFREVHFAKEEKKERYEYLKKQLYVRSVAKARNLSDTLKATDYATEAHKGQTRKNSDIPYIYHPLTLACHALAMNIVEDDILAACLLHDVLEDCGKNAEELPVSEDAKNLVVLLTHGKTNDQNREAVMDAYYDAIAKEPGAALIKCMDRCNNLTTMSWGLRRERILRMIKETEQYYPALLDVVKTSGKYCNAAWLLEYQIESMLDIYSSFLRKGIETF